MTTGRLFSRLALHAYLRQPSNTPPQHHPRQHIPHVMNPHRNPGPADRSQNSVVMKTGVESAQFFCYNATIGLNGFVTVEQEE